MTPEVRLSPDGYTVAIRDSGLAHYPWKTTDPFTRLRTDAAVADWTPLLRASNEGGAA